MQSCVMDGLRLADSKEQNDLESKREEEEF